MEDSGTDWYIDLNFGLYRDYRIEKMADAQGNIREGIFIPFLQNGILYDKAKRYGPKQILRPYWKFRVGLVRRHVLTVNVTREMRDRMIAEGVVDPNSKKYSPRVGYVCNSYGTARRPGHEL